VGWGLYRLIVFNPPLFFAIVAGLFPVDRAEQGVGGIVPARQNRRSVPRSRFDGLPFVRLSLS